jgi:diphthamide biosynthesis protein 3
MAENIYDEIEIEDMTYDPALEIYHYPCPCGDRFEIAIADLRDNEDIAVCPSCSLMIRVIFEVVSLPTAMAASSDGGFYYPVTDRLPLFAGRFTWSRRRGVKDGRAGSGCCGGLNHGH